MYWPVGSGPIRLGSDYRVAGPPLRGMWDEWVGHDVDGNFLDF